MNWNRVLGLRAGYAPAGVAEVRIGEELEGSTAGTALKVMFNLIRRPLVAEEILQRACTLGYAQFAVIYSVQEPAGEFEIFTRLLEA